MILFLHLLITLGIVVGVLYSMRVYARRRAPEAEGILDGFCSLAGYFFIFGACWLMLVACWRIVYLGHVRANWTKIASEVVQCSLDYETLSPRIDPDNVDYFGVSCVFQPLEKEQSPLLFQACCGEKEDVHDWLDYYSPGYRLPVYRNKINPKDIRLGGIENTIIFASPQQAAKQAFYFAVLGAIFWFFARWKSERVVTAKS